jgi:hypothetical protein
VARNATGKSEFYIPSSLTRWSLLGRARPVMIRAWLVGGWINEQRSARPPRYDGLGVGAPKRQEASGAARADDKVYRVTPTSWSLFLN